MSDMPTGFLLFIGAVVGVAFIMMLSYAFGEGQTNIAHKCETLGKFENSGKVYECKESLR